MLTVLYLMKWRKNEIQDAFIACILSFYANKFFFERFEKKKISQWGLKENKVASSAFRMDTLLHKKQNVEQKMNDSERILCG